MTNPLDAYFETKEAGGMDVARSVGRRAAGAVGKGALGGMGAAGGAAAVGAVGVAASKLWDAVTKAHDFRSMMGSTFNADLHELHATQPKQFNEAYSSLRRFNPGFAKDPMVAGTYMRRIMEMRPNVAGGALIDALGHRDRVPPSMVGEMFSRAGQQGAGFGAQQALKGEHDEAMAARKAEDAGELQKMRTEQSHSEMLGQYFRKTPPSSP